MLHVLFCGFFQPFLAKMKLYLFKFTVHILILAPVFIFLMLEWPGRLYLLEQLFEKQQVS